MERLGQVVVGAHLQPDDAIDGLAAAGEDDDADIRFAAQRLGQGQAVLARQHEVEDDEIDGILGHDPAHRRAVTRGADAVTLADEVVLHDLADIVLVVDDQNDICEVVQDYLVGEGYRVSTASDGTTMRRVMAQNAIDLVILDLMLPGEDGLTLAQALRGESNIGIIILTGRGETVDRIIGLEMGADDYLPKPFHLRELLARVKSVLRRAAARGNDKPSPGGRSKARFAGWDLDLSTRELVSPAGSEVRLTTGEFDLLAAFVNNANQVLSRDRPLPRSRRPGIRARRSPPGCSPPRCGNPWR